MSTTDGFLRVGNHVINMAAINHIWFDNCEPETAYIDFGEADDEGWDLVLYGPSAIALKAHFDREGEGR